MAYSNICLRRATGPLRIGIMLRMWTKSNSSPFSHSASTSSIRNLCAPCQFTRLEGFDATPMTDLTFGGTQGG